MPSPELIEAQKRAENQIVLTGSETPQAARDPNNEPDFESPSYKAQKEDVILMRDVYGGTKTMRTRKTTYLPQHAVEKDSDYQKRLARALLFNATKRTIEGYIGLVFRENPKLNDDVPAPLREHAENIDLQGRHLDVFSKDLAESALTDGHGFIHVDYPKVDLQLVRTLDDERRARNRPYWIHVPKLNAINWRYEYRNGEPVLTLFVYKETVIRAAGRFGQQIVDRIRVLWEGGFEVWEQDSRGKWFMVDGGVTSNQEIPVVPLYSNRTGFLESCPPLLDLAYENIGHYVNSNEHEMSLARARIPMPFFSNVKPEEVTWGPNYAVFAEADDASATMLESAGNALEASAQDLKDREGRMAVLGASMLVRETRQAETAEAKRIDAAETDSALATFARGIGDALENALRFHARYLQLGDDSGGSVTVNNDFREFELDASQLRELREMAAAGQISKDTLWFNMGRARYLPDDFDGEVERQKIDSEIAGVE